MDRWKRYVSVQMDAVHEVREFLCRTLGQIDLAAHRSAQDSWSAPCMCCRARGKEAQKVNVSVELSLRQARRTLQSLVRSSESSAFDAVTPRDRL